MAKFKISILICLMIFLPFSESFASSARHHAIKMAKSLLEVVSKPLSGIFIKGPKDVKEMYQYEVNERESVSKRGLLRYKLLALWRAPSVEIKAVIDGLVKGVSSAGRFLKEFLSIPFGD